MTSIADLTAQPLAHTHPTVRHEALTWFIQDHDLLNPALDALAASVESQTTPSQALLMHLHDHMAEHFGLEEAVLFPAVPFTPSVVLLLAEHDALWQAWHTMATHCQTGSADWTTAVTTYRQHMLAHMHEENACLLPSCQRDMTTEALNRLQRALDNALNKKDWIERPALSRQVTPMPMVDSNRIQYHIQPNCRVEWVTLPQSQGLKPHVSPHAQTLVLLQGSVHIITPHWAGSLNQSGQALQLDPVVSLAVEPLETSQLLVIKAPVEYPAL